MPSTPFIPGGGSGNFPTGPGPAGIVIRQRQHAEQLIQSKHDALGGLPGARLVIADEGLIGILGGFLRRFANGTIFYHQAVAEEAFYVGRASPRYAEVGGPTGFLGWPTSDDRPDPVEPGSGVTRFQNGAIYWWPDLPPIEMQPVSLRYAGFHCFGETDELSASDEPYFTFGVIPLMPNQGKTLRTSIYEGVDAGESRSDDIELYRGLPFGAVLTITLSEHDQGDPDKYREQVDKEVDLICGKIAEGLGGVPVVGIALGVVASFGLPLVAPAITDAVNELIGTGDDQISAVPVTLTPKEMMRLTRAEPRDFEGIRAHLESPLLSGDGASYKVYFTVEVAR